MHEIYRSKARNFIFRSSSQSSPEITKPSNSRSSLFENININEAIDSLNKDGFKVGINLPKAVVMEIRQLAKRTLCYGNGKRHLDFYYAHKEQAQAKYGQKFFIGSYDNTALLCPAIQKLENDPILLEITAQYLKADPVHKGNQLWWSFPVESTIYKRRRAVQIFNYNWDGCRLLKFSFYITDVDLCSSPHVCVRGSHVKKKLSHRLLRRGRSYQEISKYYGYENIVPICGKAGFGFVEDTLCFHKETPPGSQERLTLEVIFSHR